MEFKDYMKYKWFFTSSGKLVVGGKSAEQNDELIKRMKKESHEFVVMHTSQPGSPFSFIVSKPEELSKSDLEETAIFTGCFSRAWKLGKKKAIIDIFRASQLYKSPSMKQGTWGLNGKIQKTTVEIKLVLTKQKGKLRAVPEQSTKSSFLSISPGKIDKVKALSELSSALKNKFTPDEILSALPSGGIIIN